MEGLVSPSPSPLPLNSSFHVEEKECFRKSQIVCLFVYSLVYFNLAT